MILAAPGFLEMLKSIFDWFVSTVLHTVLAVRMVFSVHDQIGGVFGWIPDSLYVILSFTFSIVIIYKILNWE